MLNLLATAQLKVLYVFLFLNETAEIRTIDLLKSIVGFQNFSTFHHEDLG